MATYYWVGGAGTWDASTTTNWASSSGGSGGAGFPTSADNVVFDASSGSTYTVTIVTGAVCNDLTATGTVGATLSLGVSQQLDVYGSLSFPATGLTWSGGSGSSVFFTATTTGKTVTTNGVSFGVSGNTSARFDGVGGGWTLGSALTSNNVTVANGSFDTGNFNVTVASSFSSSATTTRSVSLGSSTITCQGTTAWTFTTTTNLTFNAGTSQITCSATSPVFSGGGLTYYNVSFTSAGSGTTTINGANTFNNLTQTSRSATGLRIIRFGANQTISGTLTFGAGNTAIRRMFVATDTSGTQRTITLNGTLATLADVDFRDIATAGSVGTWTGTRLGNAGNVSGITTSTPKTVYWNLAGTQNWSATGWATTNNGVPAVNNFPLAQDTAVFTEAGAAGTVTIDTSWRIGSIQMADGVSNRTTAFTLATGAQIPEFYGNITLFSSLTLSGTGVLTFGGYGITQTITSAGITFTQPITCNAPTGTFNLADAFTQTSATGFVHTAGTVDLNNQTLTCYLWSSSNSNTRSIAFGTGKIAVTGNAATVLGMSTATNFTYTGTSKIEFTYSGSTGTRTITPPATGATESNALNIFVTAGTDTVTVSGAARFRDFNLTGFAGTLTYTSSSRYFGDLTFVSGLTLGSIAASFTFAKTSGTQTITTAGKTLDISLTIDAAGATVSLLDALTLGSTRTLFLSTGTLTTNGNALTTGTFSSSNSSTRSLNLGASTVTITGTGTCWSIDDSTNMSLNAGTSSIVFSGTSAGVTMLGGGLAYYNITTPTSLSLFTFSNSNGSCNNFSCTQTLAGEKRIAFVSNITVNGTLSLLGAAGNQRVEFVGSPTGTPATVTAAAVSLTDVNFRDIVAAGAAISWTGTRLGDEGGNTNITFAAPKTVYWNQPAGGYWYDVAWATSSGGAVAATNQPLPQDTAIFDNTGSSPGATITFSATINSFGGVDASGLTNSLTFDTGSGASAVINCYGSIFWPAAVTVTGAALFTINAAGVASISQVSIANATITAPLAFSGYGTVLLLGNITTTASVTYGGQAGMVVDLNDYSVTCASMSRTVTTSTTLAFGTGVINVTGNDATVWNFADLTGFSYTGTPTVNFTYSGSTGTRTVSNGNTAGGTEANAVDINITAGSDTFTFLSGCSMRNLNYTGFSGVGTTGISSFIYGNLTLSPTQTISSSGTTSTFASTSGVKTITTNGVAIDRVLVFNGIGGTWSLQDALAMGTSRTLGLYAGTLTTNGYNVTCARFNAAANVALANRTLNMGASTFTCAGTSGTTSSWFVENGAYTLTINAGTSTIVLSEPYTGLSTQNFGGSTLAGDAFTFYNLVYTGAQPSIITGNNTFNSITVSAYPMALSFDPGTTQTVNQFNVSGTSGNNTVLASTTPGSQWYLAKNTGSKVLVSNCTISDSAASPAGYWFAPTSQGNVNGGNNTGWNFVSDGQNSGFMLLI